MLSSLVKNIFEISFFLLIGRAINLLGSLIIIPLILKNVGSEGYGFIALVASFMVYLKFTNLGVTGALKITVSKLFNDKKITKINELITTVQFFYLILLLLNLIIFTLIFIFYPKLFFVLIRDFSDKNIIPSIFLLLSIQVMINSYIRNIYVNTFHGIDKLEKLTIFEVIYNVFYSLCYIIFLLNSPNLIGISSFLLINAIIYALSTILFLKINLPSFKYLLNFNFKKNFLSISNLSFWFFLTSVISSLIFVVDYLLISTLYSVSALGIYVLSKKIFELPTSIFPIAYSSFPKIQKIYNSKDFNELLKSTEYVLRLNIISKVGLIIPIALFSKEIFSIWLGDSYYPGLTVIYLFLIIYSTYTLTGICSIIIQVSENLKYVFLPSVVELLLIVVLSAIFYFFIFNDLRSFVLAILISRIYNIFYMCIIAKKVLNKNLILDFIKNLFPFLITIFFVILFKIIIESFFFNFVYLGYLIIIIFYLLTYYFYILTSLERNNINFFIKNKLK